MKARAKKHAAIIAVIALVAVSTSVVTWKPLYAGNIRSRSNTSFQSIRGGSEFVFLLMARLSPLPFNPIDSMRFSSRFKVNPYEGNLWGAGYIRTCHRMAKTRLG